MVISDSQIQDLGVIHVDEMPDSSEELQAFKPELTTPKDKLARECEFKWISAPPVPPSSVTVELAFTKNGNRLVMRSLRD